jgi:hypothetical protein
VRSWLALAVAMGALGWAVEARAQSLVPGDLLGIHDWAAAGEAADPVALERFDASRDAAALSFTFTPRNPLSLIFGSVDEARDEAAELRLSVSRDRVQDDRFASLQPSGGMTDGDAAPRTLEIGGALRWADWMVGSSYTRAQLFGGEADLLSATLGYGRLQARLALGQAETRSADDLDVLMLSTDIAAWSWLTLESDVALGASERRADETRAVGRLGVRLNF